MIGAAGKLFTAGFHEGAAPLLFHLVFHHALALSLAARHRFDGFLTELLGEVVAAAWRFEERAIVVVAVVFTTEGTQIARVLRIEVTGAVAPRRLLSRPRNRS